MGAVPDLQLLANGDILVPVKEAGAWRVERLQPSDTGYAGWLAEVQQRARGPGLLTRGVSFWLSGVLVLMAIPLVIFLLSVIAKALT